PRALSALARVDHRGERAGHGGRAPRLVIGGRARQDLRDARGEVLHRAAPHEGDGVRGGDRRAQAGDEDQLPVRPRRVERRPVLSVTERVFLPEEARPRGLGEALELGLEVRPLAQREGLEGHARHDTVACDMAQAIPPLPDTLPADPLPLVAAWLAEAARAVRNSTSMTLATVGADGRPAARMVICRGLAAAASEQSRPLPSRAALLARIAEVTARAQGGEVARPKRWGGYRVWAERVELWVGQPGRAHDRARWTRTLAPAGDGYAGGAWSG